VGNRTSLNQLFHMLHEFLTRVVARVGCMQAQYQDLRPGEARHSQADVSKARRLLGSEPTHDIRSGLDEALGWYVEEFLPNERASVLPAAC
jgi:UDP-N-acetylglucosamine 4-epimerase